MNLLASRFPHCDGSKLAALCLALLICSPVHAARTARRTVRHPQATVSPAKSVQPHTVTARLSPAVAAGMVVAIDPETGALVPPTAEQVRILTAAERTGLMRTSEGLAEVRLPDGAVMVDLQGRFMEYSLVQLDRAGCPHFFGVNDETWLLALLARRAPDSPPACEER
jgi:hypothetical protein